MNFANLKFYDNQVLFGRDSTKNIVAVEVEDKKETAAAVLFLRNGEGVTRVEEEFRPFVLVNSLALLEKFDDEWVNREMAGSEDFKYIVYCKNLNGFKKLSKYLKSVTGLSNSSPFSPYYYYTDLVHQYLLTSGKTLFKGMSFENLLRMQIDIETYCEAGYEFPNPDRESDRITIISMSDSQGWERVISGAKMSEPEMLKEMLQEIEIRDPDIIEGHNFHKFDLNYIERRAKRHKIPLKMGRDGSLLKSHNSRMNIAERTITYPKYEIYGRHIIDTWILAQLYDVTSRDLESYGLKDIARHFKVAPEGRTYVNHADIPRLFDEDPATLEKYSLDDVRETNAISRILSMPYFMQTQIFPFSYQNVTVRGNASRIDSLFIREYIHRGQSIPRPPMGRSFEGAYTDMFKEGVVENVLHVDVASLYPSVMLAFQYFPAGDRLKIFESLLRDLTQFRLEAKREAKSALSGENIRNFFDNLQATFKILINSFYGYLGFSFGHFADFDMASATTAKGREIIKKMVDWLSKEKCDLIELDTDGIYFTPSAAVDSADKEESMVDRLNGEMPEGINLELDGRYRAMFSYKMKNYVLLDYDGEMLIKGSGLKSRGLERFQRKFMEEMFYLLLSGKKDKIEDLYRNYKDMITNHQWEARDFQKSDTLQESPENYRQKVAQSERNAAAVYELALESEREYQAGDQISYYITGDKASVTAYKNCKFAYLWDKENPDENTKYYKSKLDALYKKFKKYF